MPPLKADIAYTGSGRLRGRWEIVLSGDERPTSDDLLTEASLPPEERGTQRRYAGLGTIQRVPSADRPRRAARSRRRPHPLTTVDGTYLILLRVEADRRQGRRFSRSAAGAGAGVVHSGAVAGFPMPVLRYVVGAGGGDLSRVAGRTRNSSYCCRATPPSFRATPR